jgi:hypothetical protein
MAEFLKAPLLWAATNTAGDDLWKRALEFYAKAKAIRHNKSMNATQPTHQRLASHYT